MRASDLRDIDEEEIRKLTLWEIKNLPRWKLIWRLFWQKKKLFPDLPDELVLEKTKEEILAMRQLMRAGLV
ncbi:MAG: hypothetical protein B6U94_08595 [Thermofilum sp. ex4484_79]|nr:MAG: hypothetical protein B6U94_08595 [Thermofilum sp. ex4484_79]